jgi:hypothetical protein
VPADVIRGEPAGDDHGVDVGRLYLKIGPTSWGGIDPSGSFKVKVKVGG